MATVTIKHASLTGAAANPAALVDGPKWDAAHTITGLENVQNVDTTNATNLTSGTVPAARMPALTGDVTMAAGSTATTLAAGNAGNLNSGTLGAARLPTPTASTIGGVKSLANVSHKWINSIGADGTPTQTQPDAADVTFTAASGTARTVNARLSDIIDLNDYGADPTGVADSAPALRAAAIAVPYGGTINAPGIFSLNTYVGNAILDLTALGIPNKAFTIRGVGWQLKVGSNYSTPSGSIFKIGSAIPNTIDFMYMAPTQQVSGLGFRDFAIVPAGGAYTQPFGRHGINIDTTAGTTGYVDFLYVDNIFIDNFAAGWGFYVHGLAGGNTLISSVIQNSSFMTTKFVNIADDVSFLNNVYGANALTYVSAATVAAGGSGGTNGTQTVTVSGGTGTAATLNVTVAGGAITAINSVTSGGFYTIFPTSPAAVTGAGLTGATVNLTQLFPNMGIDASQVSGATSLKIIGNNFVSQDGAIRITSGLTPIIRDNEIEQNPGNNTTSACINITSGTNIVGAVITGNSISNNASGSISPIFVGAAQGTVIFANTIYVPTGGPHATISASATNTRILDNTCYVNGALVNNGTWTDSGSLTDAPTGILGEYFETGTGNNNASATVTISIASPGVVTWTGHKFTVGAATTAVKFSTTGALPTGITAGTTYYLKAADANTFWIATSAANALASTFITTTGSQSGTHTGDIRVSMTTGVQQDVSAITLAAGDWDVSGQMLKGAGATTTVTFLGGNLALTSNSVDRTFGRRLSFQYSSNTFVPTNNEFTVFDFAPTRFSLSSPTTIFLVGDDSFGTSTMTCSGWLRARRVR